MYSGFYRKRAECSPTASHQRLTVLSRCCCRFMLGYARCLRVRKLLFNIDNHKAGHRRHCSRWHLSCRMNRADEFGQTSSLCRLHRTRPCHSLNFASVDLHRLRLANSQWQLLGRQFQSPSELLLSAHTGPSALTVRQRDGVPCTSTGAASVRSTTCMHLWLLPRPGAALPMYAAQEVRRSVTLVQGLGCM